MNHVALACYSDHGGKLFEWWDRKNAECQVTRSHHGFGRKQANHDNTLSLSRWNSKLCIQNGQISKWSVKETKKKIEIL